MSKPQSKIERHKYYILHQEDIRYQASFRRKQPKIVYIKNCESCGAIFKSSWENQTGCKPTHTLKFKQRKRAIEKYGQPISRFYKKELILIYDNRPEGMQVDHIIPLNGENVSGLHIPWNLQYLSPEANNKKSNKT
jgi:5-methylcytosine-specific restriction endonuclease McrA